MYAVLPGSGALSTGSVAWVDCPEGTVTKWDGSIIFQTKMNMLMTPGYESNLRPMGPHILAKFGTEPNHPIGYSPVQHVEPRSISLLSFLLAIVVGLVGCSVEASAPLPESVPSTVLGDPMKVGKSRQKAGSFF